MKERYARVFYVPGNHELRTQLAAGPLVEYRKRPWCRQSATSHCNVLNMTALRITRAPLSMERGERPQLLQMI